MDLIENINSLYQLGKNKKKTLPFTPICSVLHRAEQTMYKRSNGEDYIQNPLIDQSDKVAIYLPQFCWLNHNAGR